MRAGWREAGRCCGWQCPCSCATGRRRAHSAEPQQVQHPESAADSTFQEWVDGMHSTARSIASPARRRLRQKLLNGRSHRGGPEAASSALHAVAVAGSGVPSRVHRQRAAAFGSSQTRISAESRNVIILSFHFLFHYGVHGFLHDSSFQSINSPGPPGAVQCRHGAVRRAGQGGAHEVQPVATVVAVEVLLDFLPLQGQGQRWS